jgi:hypothetical protein
MFSCWPTQLESKCERTHIGYIAQWLERLTADQQVPGSNPGVPSYNLFPLEMCAGKIAKRSVAMPKLISPLAINVSKCFHPPL